MLKIIFSSVVLFENLAFTNLNLLRRSRPIFRVSTLSANRLTGSVPRLLLGIGIVIALLMWSFILYAYQSSLREDLQLYESRSDLKASQLQTALYQVEANTQALASAVVLYECAVQSCNKPEFETFIGRFLSFYNHFTQARIIDELGNEIARWDYNPAEGSVSRSQNLQYKGDRYYFKEAQKLAVGDTYLSSLDYNYEFGELQTPFVPTIRSVAKRVVDGKAYFVVLNRDVSNILDQTLSFGWNRADADADADIQPVFIISNNNDINSDGVIDDRLVLESRSRGLTDPNFLVNHPTLSLVNSSMLQTVGERRYVFDEGTLLIKTAGLGSEKSAEYQRLFTVAAWIPSTVNYERFFEKYSTFVVLILVFIALLVTISARLLKSHSQLLAKQSDLESSVNLLSQAEKALQEKAEKQAQLFSVIGHELRTPVASLKMIGDEMNLHNVKPHGAEICSITDSLISILDDLRFVVQPERAKAARSIVDNPYQVCERSIRSLIQVYKDADIQLHFSAESEVNTRFSFGAQSLRQIVVNLLKNSAIHSGASDVWINLSLSDGASNGEKQLEVLIQDNGKGIRADKVKTLFQAFVRGDTDADGTGLGLFIVDALCKQCGGDVEYFDSSEGGAGFRVTIQLEQFDGLETDYGKDEGELPLEGLKFLFAEDQLTLQKLTCKQLELNQAEVVGVLDGMQALTAMENQTFDVVLTDINMPNMNGYELTKTLRDKGYQGIIIGITAATIGAETEKLLSLGADAVLQKPISMGALKKLLFDLNK